jgi:hypothetical protein
MVKKVKSRAELGNAGGVVIVLLLIALIAVGCGWWYWARHHKTTTVTSTMPCGPSDMSLSTGNTNGAAGTMYMDAIVKNMSNTACTVTGWPTVGLRDASNAPLGGNATPTNAFAPTTLTVAPGATVHAAVGFPQAGNFDSGVCSVQSAKLALYLSSTTTPLTTPLQEQSCPGFSVSAFQNGN